MRFTVYNKAYNIQQSLQRIINTTKPTTHDAHKTKLTTHNKVQNICKEVKIYNEVHLTLYNRVERSAILLITTYGPIYLLLLRINRRTT